MSEQNLKNFNQSIRLKTKADLHLARKAWHFCGVAFIIWLYHSTTRAQGLQIAFMVTFTFLTIDILRQSVGPLNTFVFKVLGPIMREREKNHFAGTSWLMIGVSLVIYLFSKDVVTLALLFLAVGDPIASLVGVKYGKDKIVGHKTLQGSLAAFAVCFLISGGYFFFQNIMTERILIVSVIAGLIGAICELVPVLKLDDNFSYPVLSSLLLWVLFYVFGGA